VLGKKLDGLIGMGHDLDEGNVLVDDLLHASGDSLDVFFGQHPAQGELTIIAVAYRGLDSERALGEEILTGFAEDEEERARIDSQTRGGGDVEKLYILVVVYGIGQGAAYIVDFGMGQALETFEMQFVINFEQGAACRHLYRFTIVDTVYTDVCLLITLSHMSVKMNRAIVGDYFLFL